MSPPGSLLRLGSGCNEAPQNLVRPELYHVKCRMGRGGRYGEDLSTSEKKFWRKLLKKLTASRCGIGPFQPHLDHFRTTLRAPNANNRVDEIPTETPHVQCAGEGIGAAFPAFLRGPILKHNDDIQRNSVEPKAIASTLRKVQSARLSGWPNLLGRNGFEPGKA